MKVLDYNSQGLLCLNGAELHSILPADQRPCYIYSKAVIERKMTDLKSALQPIKPQFFYAMKANSHPTILKLIASHGFGVDVVSGGEMKRALLCGISPEKILFSGVGKSADEIKLAIEQKILQLNIESIPELERVIELAEKHAEPNQTVTIGLRVNPNIDVQTHPAIATGLKDHKFGIDLEDLDQALTQLKSSKVRLSGLSVHLGSQIKDIKGATECIEKLKPYYQKYHWKMLDLGGGFYVDYTKDSEDDAEFLNQYAGEIIKSLSWFQGKIYFEPGRYVVARSGVLLAKVEYVKETSHKNFLILNSGMNHFMRPALYQAWHRILPAKKSGSAELLFDVVGPVCESTDVFGRNYNFFKPAPGDWMAIADVGAYGFVMVNSYNLFDFPNEIFCD